MSMRYESILNLHSFFSFLPGVLELNLNCMPTPSKKASQCNLKQIPSAGGAPVKTFSLFEQRRIRGFWPCYSEDKEGRQLTVSFLFFVICEQ